jgi:ATP-dependent DNA helicase RecG
MSQATHFIRHILNNELQYIKGVGPNKAEAFKALGYTKIKELILHIPIQYVDRRKTTDLKNAISHSLLSQIVTIDKIVPKNSTTKITKIICSDSTYNISLIFFNISKAVLVQFEVGQKIIISGKVSFNHGELQMMHPDVIAPFYKADSILTIDPIYPATTRMNSKSIAKTIQEILKILPTIPEWLPQDIIAQYQLPSLNLALKLIHTPKNNEDLINIDKAITRLALDEILAEQIVLDSLSKSVTKFIKQPVNFTGNLSKTIMQKLPFELTIDQYNAIQDIANDQLKNIHMLRILQGDVGSGKTIVAFSAALNAVEAGFQAAIMAPTEILAKQHFNSLQKLLGTDHTITIGLLISNMKPKEKTKIQVDIETGQVKIIIGTHALIQSSLKFKKLGIAIIDEQHKFGVQQRLDLVTKQSVCDFLMMSATPIPRTLNMIYCNNIATSTIKTKPANRKKIITSIMPANKIDILINSLVVEIDKGAKVYWICPLIEESEKIALNNAKKRYEYLELILKEKVAVLHSKLKIAERNKIMDDFADQQGKIKLVVATTVIEVGVDVPDATIIVIEHAERFGLAQMHQLRGRVGRSDKQSYCILLYQHPVSDVAKLRMEAMRQSDNGFFLAEKDLEIRGGGRITNTQQSGLPNFKIYDFTKHAWLLDITRILLKRINLNELQPNTKDIIKLLLDFYHHSEDDEAYISKA